MKRTRELSLRIKGLLRTAVVSLALAGASLAAPAGLGATEARADGIIKLTTSQRTRAIEVPLAKPTTFRTDSSFNEIVVGDPDIALVTPLTDRSFYVVGSRAGTTGIALFNEERELIGSIDVEVGPDTDRLNAALRTGLGDSAVSARREGGKVVLTGEASSSQAARKAREIASSFDKDVIDTVRVEGSMQVQLEVRFIEAQRNRTKELGISLDGGKGNGRFQTQTGTGMPGVMGSIISGSLPFGQIVGNMISHGMDIDVIIQALEEKGVARRLAEPNLVALSGDTASFLAGGEFPVPVAADSDEVTIEFKKFGVGLEFTPTVLENGLINMVISPEVSTIDPTSSVKFNNVEIPGLVVRRASTTVELRDGQSFVMAGLLQSTANYNLRKFPWLGDIPIIGALFRSTSYRKQETDLVIIVTPRLVNPLAPGAKIASPLDSETAPNDVDLFVNGKTGISRARLRTVAEAEEGILAAGHVLDF